MRLTQIRDFLAVVDAGSINAAARKLGVSQPGLTKSLGSLEVELGTSLLKRSPTGVTLTALGRAFHVRVRAGYAELAKAQEELARGARAQVALGFGPFFAAQIVPQAVLRFREKFPDVQLRLVEGLRHSTGPMVRDATLDMSLAPLATQGQEDPAIRFRPIAHLNQIVVARRGHPLASTRSASGLAGQEWVGNLRQAATVEILRTIGVPEPRQIIECESFSAMRALLAGSNLLSVVQHPFLAMPEVGDALQEIPIAERLPGLTVGLHTRADAPLTRPAAALARLLSEIGRKLLQRRPVL
ncbi:MAG: LysR family transcriptional regulator [Rubrivivax sp.]|nr:LysR family transcriptional regulator [Rubrivivax sp.]